MANSEDDASHHTADKNEETNVQTHHADKKEETVMMSRFRKDFNESAFGEDFIPFERFTKPSNTSDMKSHAEIQDMIHILTHWETGVGDMSQSEFRKSNRKHGYRISKHFMAEDYSVNNTIKYRLKRKEPTKQGGGTLIISVEDTFDAIELAHNQHLSHQKVASTYNHLASKYHNITERVVRIFVRKCPICLMQQQKSSRNKTKGAARPIISDSFHDRVQVDLISFQHDPVPDHNGVEMRYILVTKDHCTTFIWLRAIPRKEATIVAAELRHLFHEIGFPLIFHSDNGTEFMASVLELIRKDPFSYYVHGRPRTPSDQGSVERGNRDIQNLISLKIEEYKTVHNKIVTWVDVLPEVTSSINSGVRYGNNNLSSYQHVYGMKYVFPLDIPHSEFSSVTTINDLDGLVNNPQFSEKLKRLGYNLQRAQKQKIMDNSKCCFRVTS